MRSGCAGRVHVRRKFHSYLSYHGLYHTCVAGSRVHRARATNKDSTARGVRTRQCQRSGPSHRSASGPMTSLAAPTYATLIASLRRPSRRPEHTTPALRSVCCERFADTLRKPATSSERRAHRTQPTAVGRLDGRASAAAGAGAAPAPRSWLLADRASSVFHLKVEYRRCAICQQPAARSRRSAGASRGACPAVQATDGRGLGAMGSPLRRRGWLPQRVGKALAANAPQRRSGVLRSSRRSPKACDQRRIRRRGE